MLTQEQKQARRLGGSMIAAALGLSRYKTPLDAYLDLRGEAPEVESNPNIERGEFLEPAITAWSTHRLGIDWWKPELSVVHPTNPYFTYSPDGIEKGATSSRILEVKAPGRNSAAEWGEDGTDQIPTEYLMQGAWGLAVTGRNECIFAALIDGELRIFKHVRDMELEGRLLERATNFIENHVKPGVPPEATFGDEKTLRRMYPRADAPHLAWNDLNSVQQSTVANFLALHGASAQAEREMESRKVLVQDIIKDASGIDGLPQELGFSRIDWKEAKPAMHSGSWKELATLLMSDKEPATQEALKKQFTPEVGSRRFTPIKAK